MDIETTLKGLINHFKVIKQGPYYYMGGRQKPVDSRMITDNLGPELYNTIMPLELVAMLDRLIEEKMKGKIVSKDKMFDNSQIIDSLNDILSHEELHLDMATMQYRRRIGNSEDFETIEPSNLNNIISANASARALNSEKYPISEKMLLSQIEYNKIKTRQSNLDSIVTNSKYNSDERFSDEYFGRMHKTAKITQDKDIFISLMKHFLWQVKRRILERKTYNDIMICFYGKQGVGKSFLMNAIFGNILDSFYNASISLDNLMDERWTRALNTQYLMNIEEMDAGKLGNISGKHLALIKKVITGSEATYRPMGTNTTEVIKIKASFISNANFHFYDIINDESGMRRFFEFRVGIEEGKRLDYAEVAWLKENAAKMYSSINENLERGYWDTNSTVGIKIDNIQKSYIKKPAHIEFFENRCKFVDDMNYKNCISHNEIYSEYVRYSRDIGLKEAYIIQNNRFKSKIEDFWQDVIKTHGHVNKYKLELINTTPTSYNSFKVADEGEIADWANK